jgi:hypothetical protein
LLFTVFKCKKKTQHTERERVREGEKIDNGMSISKNFIFFLIADLFFHINLEIKQFFSFFLYFHFFSVKFKKKKSFLSI